MPQLILRRIAHRAVQVAILAAGILIILLVFSRQAHAATSAPATSVTSAVTSAATPVTSAATCAASAASAALPPLRLHRQPRPAPAPRRLHSAPPAAGCHVGGGPVPAATGRCRQLRRPAPALRRLRQLGRPGCRPGHLGSPPPAPAPAGSPRPPARWPRSRRRGGPGRPRLPRRLPASVAPAAPAVTSAAAAGSRLVAPSRRCPGRPGWHRLRRRRPRSRRRTRLRRLHVGGGPGHHGRASVVAPVAAAVAPVASTAAPAAAPAGPVAPAAAARWLRSLDVAPVASGRVGGGPGRPVDAVAPGRCR